MILYTYTVLSVIWYRSHWAQCQVIPYAYTVVSDIWYCSLWDQCQVILYTYAIVSVIWYCSLEAKCQVILYTYTVMSVIWWISVLLWDDLMWIISKCLVWPSMNYPVTFILGLSEKFTTRLSGVIEYDHIYCTLLFFVLTNQPEEILSQYNNKQSEWH